MPLGRRVSSLLARWVFCWSFCCTGVSLVVVGVVPVPDVLVVVFVFAGSVFLADAVAVVGLPVALVLAVPDFGDALVVLVLGALAAALPGEGPFATVVWVPPVGFGGCVFGPPLPLPCPANDGPVAMNTAATTVAITEFFLAIMAPLQRAIGPQGSCRRHCPLWHVKRFVYRDLHGSKNSRARAISDGLVAAVTGAEATYLTVAILQMAGSSHGIAVRDRLHGWPRSLPPNRRVSVITATLLAHRHRDAVQLRRFCRVTQLA